MPTTLRPALLALLCAASLASPALAPAVSAQALPAADDFSTLRNGRVVAVVDDTGAETTGRLLRVTADALTIKARRGERVFERPRVLTVHEVGDPVKNGLLIGLAAGGGLGIIGGAAVADCGSFFEGYVPCSTGEHVRIAAVYGAVYGAVGAGIGALVDKLIGGRTLVYARPTAPGGAAVSWAPILDRSRAGLRVTARW